MLRAMRRLLLVHHTPSPAMQAMFESVLAGASTDEIEGVEVNVRPALTAGAADVLGAAGYLLGTPANILPGSDPPPPIWPVCARRQRHRRSGQGGAGHHHRPAMAPGQAAGMRDRAAGQG